MAIDPVLIQFAVAGVVEVGRAFDTIEQRIVRMEQAGTRASEAGAGARVRAARGEAETREREYKKVQQYAERYEKEQTREAERQAKQRERITAQGARDAERQAKRVADQEIKEADRAAREIERLEQYKMRVRIRSSEMAGRAAVAEAREEAVARERMVRGFGGAAARGVRGMLGTIGSLAGTGLMIGGGFEMANVARKELNAERQAALIVNAVTTGGAPPPGANVANILGQASQVSRETGMSKEDVQAGVLAYVKSAKHGDFPNAMANMAFFAKLAKTTGADITEVASGAGMLQSQNPKLAAPQMQQMLLDMLAQGKAGSRSITEMVGLAGVVGSVRGIFGEDTATTQRKLLGLTQLGAPEAGSAEEAARGVKQMALQLEKPKNVKLLRGWGVQYNEHGQVASPEQMIEAVLTGTHGNLQKIGRVFETRSGGLMRHMADTFNTAGGGGQGIAAVRAEMASVTGATTTAGQLEDQFQQLMQTPAEKFQKALNDVSEVIAMRLEPLLGKLADKLDSDAIGRFMQSVLDLAEWLINNPWQGLGAAVTLAITKEIAAEAIGTQIASILKTGIGQALASGITGGVATIAIAYAGKLAIDFLAQQEVNQEKAGIETSVGGMNAAGELRSKARSGKVTPEDIRKAEAEVKRLEGTAAEQTAAAGSIRNRVFGTNEWHPLTGMLGSDRARALEGEAKTTTETIALMRRAIELATKSMQAFSSTVAAAPDPARHLPISSPGRS